MSMPVHKQNIKLQDQVIKLLSSTFTVKTLTFTRNMLFKNTYMTSLLMFNENIKTKIYKVIGTVIY